MDYFLLVRLVLDRLILSPDIFPDCSHASVRPEGGCANAQLGAEEDLPGWG